MFRSKLRTLSITAALSLLIVLVLDSASTAQIGHSGSYSNQQSSQLLAQQPQNTALIDTNKNYRHNNSRNRNSSSYGGHQDFGNAGRSGRDGRTGARGTTPNPSTINIIGADATARAYDLTGTDGSDGENGNIGEHARSCRVPHNAAYSVTGADGGDGGNGGDGGRGGDGGDASIYYTDQARLKDVVIKAAGGLGGEPGQGEEGGDGCECVEPEWVVHFCDWDIWARRSDIENAEWVRESSTTSPCSGSRRVDERDYVPPLPTTSTRHNRRYRLEYQGISHSEHFYCHDGDRGSTGTDGRHGADGKYGKFRLIPGETIPTEQVLHTDRLGELIGQTIELVKNVWVEQQGLRALLHPSSEVPDNYTYLQSTERPQYQIEWGATESPEALGIATVAIGADVKLNDTQANLNFNIPGTLDYVVNKQADVNVVTITGGFSPDRVTSFRVDDVIASSGESQLILTDEGALHDLLENTVIEVTCLTKQSASGLVTSNYRNRNSITFDTAAAGLGRTNMEVIGNTYTLDVSNAFGAWLKPNYDVAYEISIQQTTNSGAVYTQNEHVTFTVPAP